MSAARPRALAHSALSVADFYARSGDPLPISPARTGELRAVGDLASGLAGLARDVEARRLALYRDFVGTTVTRVSPLLLAWCAMEGVSLEDLAMRLGPDRPWPVWLCGPHPRRPTPRAVWLRYMAGVCSQTTAFRDLQRFAYSGTVVRIRARPPGFGVRVLHDQLELGAFIGGATIRTIGAGGVVVLPDALPATLAVRLPGMPLDRLVGHPLIDGAGCVVRAVGTRNCHATRIEFALPSLPWRMPWARDVAERID